MRKILLVTNHLTPYRKIFYSKFHQICESKGIDFKVLLMTKIEPMRNWDYNSLKIPFAHLMKDIHITFPINNHLNIEIKKQLKIYKPDVVIMAGSYMYLTNWIVCSYKRKYKYKLLYWNEAHFNELRNYNKLILKIREKIRNIFFSKIDGFWYSGSMSKDFCDHYSTTPKDLFFLPNLVDNTLYSKAHTCTIEEKNTLKKKWKIEKKCIIIPARLSKEKGIDKFINLLSHCNGIEKFTVVIPGTGPYKEEIESAIKQSSVDVRLLGFQQQHEMLELFSIADIFALPSLSDPNPLTCIEALWSGLPLIVSIHVGNYPEVIQSENGCVFDYNDSTNAIRKIEKILNADQAWMKNASLISLKIANDIYNPNIAVSRVIDEMIRQY